MSQYHDSARDPRRGHRMIAGAQGAALAMAVLLAIVILDGQASNLSPERDAITTIEHPRDTGVVEEVAMVVDGQKSDARALRAHAARFRACARATSEAERQRIFPALAEDCEARAKELEQSERAE